MTPHSCLFLRTLHACVLAAAAAAAAAATGSVPGTAPLAPADDRSAEMVAGISRWLDSATAASAAGRATRWRPDFTSPAAYETSIAPNRARLAHRLGVIDRRLAGAALEFAGSAAVPARVAETGAFTIDAVRWAVFEGVHGEGLWLRPKAGARARVVAIPDADETPEMLAGVGAASPRTA